MNSDLRYYGNPMNWESTKGDLISRDALKKEFEKPIDGIILSDLSLIYKCIDNAPTVEEKSYAMGYQDGLEDGIDGIIPKGEWTPVSEGLPEERINPRTNDFEGVLCTTVWGDVRIYGFGKPKGCNKPHFWHHGIIDEYVIAWQYPPEPYKEGDTE